MGMSSLALISVTALSLFSATAAHSATTGNDTVQQLLNMCTMPPSSWEGEFCVAYVMGVGDALLANGMIGLNPEPFRMCGKPSYGAMVQAFVNWAKENPREWTESRFGGVVLALAVTWPCNK